MIKVWWRSSFRREFALPKFKESGIRHNMSRNELLGWGLRSGAITVEVLGNSWYYFNLPLQKGFKRLCVFVYTSWQGQVRVLSVSPTFTCWTDLNNNLMGDFLMQRYFQFTGEKWHWATSAKYWHRQKGSQIDYNVRWYWHRWHLMLRLSSFITVINLYGFSCTTEPRRVHFGKPSS